MDILKGRPCPDCDNGVAPKGGNKGTTRYDCPTCRPEASIEFSPPKESNWDELVAAIECRARLEALENAAMELQKIVPSGGSTVAQTACVGGWRDCISALLELAAKEEVPE